MNGLSVDPGKRTWWTACWQAPASRFRVQCEYDEVTDEAFMILVLDKVTMNGVTGVAKYKPEFADVT